jgi:hypothetical protein
MTLSQGVRIRLMGASELNDSAEDGKFASGVIGRFAKSAKRKLPFEIGDVPASRMTFRRGWTGGCTRPRPTALHLRGQQQAVLLTFRTKALPCRSDSVARFPTPDPRLPRLCNTDCGFQRFGLGSFFFQAVNSQFASTIPSMTRPLKYGHSHP